MIYRFAVNHLHGNMRLLYSRIEVRLIQTLSIMKYKTMFLMLAVTSMFAGHVFAQTNDSVTQADRNRKDSVEAAVYREAQVQSRKDENRMADAKHDRKQTKAKAKNAQRIEREANDAARQSKSALRAERKAQKSRKLADKLAKRASDARDKSDKN